jgi:hypothetical protein
MPLLLMHNQYVCLQVDTITEPAVCKIESVKVIQNISHPPNPNRHSCLPAWEHQLPGKYVVAASPDVMSLAINIEIESMDTAVKQYIQALIDCNVTECFINIE